MRRYAFLALGALFFGTVAVVSPTGQQQPSAPPPPRENTPGGLAGAVPPTTTPVPYSDALAGERNFVVGVLPPFSWGPIETPKPHVPDGFTPIFNGTNLVGWHASHTNLHGTAPDFFVLDGAIVATQNPLGQGGILLTDKRYKNFELYMEVKPDYGCDSGIFFRSTEAGHAYQVTMDYLPGGSMGALILEGIANPNRGRGAGPGAAGARVGGPGRGAAPVVGGIPLGASAANGEAAWMKVWKREAWNSVRVRVEEEVPHVQVWINDALVTDAHETENRAEGGIVEGPIALQIHGGTRWVQAGFWRWRNIGIKEL